MFAQMSDSYESRLTSLGYPSHDFLVDISDNLRLLKEENVILQKDMLSLLLHYRSHGFDVNDEKIKDILDRFGGNIELFDSTDYMFKTLKIRPLMNMLIPSCHSDELLNSQKIDSGAVWWPGMTEKDALYIIHKIFQTANENPSVSSIWSNLIKKISDSHARQGILARELTSSNLTVAKLSAQLSDFECRFNRIMSERDEFKLSYAALASSQGKGIDYLELVISRAYNTAMRELWVQGRLSIVRTLIRFAWEFSGAFAPDSNVRELVELMNSSEIRNHASPLSLFCSDDIYSESEDRSDIVIDNALLTGTSKLLANNNIKMKDQFGNIKSSVPRATSSCFKCDAIKDELLATLINIHSKFETGLPARLHAAESSLADLKASNSENLHEICVTALSTISTYLDKFTSSSDGCLRCHAPSEIIQAPADVMDRLHKAESDLIDAKEDLKLQIQSGTKRGSFVTMLDKLLEEGGDELGMGLASVGETSRMIIRGVEARGRESKSIEEEMHTGRDDFENEVDLGMEGASRNLDLPPFVRLEGSAENCEILLSCMRENLVLVELFRTARAAFEETRQRLEMAEETRADLETALEGERGRAVTLARELEETASKLSTGGGGGGGGGDGLKGQFATVLSELIDVEKIIEGFKKIKEDLGEWKEENNSDFEDKIVFLHGVLSEDEDKVTPSFASMKSVLLTVAKDFSTLMTSFNIRGDAIKSLSHLLSNLCTPLSKLDKILSQSSEEVRRSETSYFILKNKYDTLGLKFRGLLSSNKAANARVTSLKEEIAVLKAANEFAAASPPTSHNGEEQSTLHIRAVLDLQLRKMDSMQGIINQQRDVISSTQNLESRLQQLETDKKNLMEIIEGLKEELATSKEKHKSELDLKDRHCEDLNQQLLLSISKGKELHSKQLSADSALPSAPQQIFENSISCSTCHTAACLVSSSPPLSTTCDPSGLLTRLARFVALPSGATAIDHYFPKTGRRKTDGLPIPSLKDTQEFEANFLVLYEMGQVAVDVIKELRQRLLVNVATRLHVKENEETAVAHEFDVSMDNETYAEHEEPDSNLISTVLESATALTSPLPIQEETAIHGDQDVLSPTSESNHVNAKSISKVLVASIDVDPAESAKNIISVNRDEMFTTVTPPQTHMPSTLPTPTNLILPPSTLSPSSKQNPEQMKSITAKTAMKGTKDLSVVVEDISIVDKNDGTTQKERTHLNVLPMELEPSSVIVPTPPPLVLSSANAAANSVSSPPLSVDDSKPSEAADTTKPAKRSLAELKASLRAAKAHKPSDVSISSDETVSDSVSKTLSDEVAAGGEIKTTEPLLLCNDAQNTRVIEVPNFENAVTHEVIAAEKETRKVTNEMLEDHALQHTKENSTNGENIEVMSSLEENTTNRLQVDEDKDNNAEDGHTRTSHPSREEKSSVLQQIQEKSEIVSIETNQQKLPVGDTFNDEPTVYNIKMHVGNLSDHLQIEQTKGENIPAEEDDTEGAISESNEENVNIGANDFTVEEMTTSALNVNQIEDNLETDNGQSEPVLPYNDEQRSTESNNHILQEKNLKTNNIQQEDEFKLDPDSTLFEQKEIKLTSNTHEVKDSKQETNTTNYVENGKNMDEIEDQGNIINFNDIDRNKMENSHEDENCADEDMPSKEDNSDDGNTVINNHIEDFNEDNEYENSPFLQIHTNKMEDEFVSANNDVKTNDEIKSISSSSNTNSSNGTQLSMLQEEHQSETQDTEETSEINNLTKDELDEKENSIMFKSSETDTYEFNDVHDDDNYDDGEEEEEKNDEDKSSQFLSQDEEDTEDEEGELNEENYMTEQEKETDEFPSLLILAPRSPSISPDEVSEQVSDNDQEESNDDETDDHYEGEEAFENDENNSHFSDQEEKDNDNSEHFTPSINEDTVFDEGECDMHESPTASLDENYIREDEMVTKEDQIPLLYPNNFHENLENEERPDDSMDIEQGNQHDDQDMS